jgi:hypothetical protein
MWMCTVGEEAVQNIGNCSCEAELNWLRWLEALYNLWRPEVSPSAAAQLVEACCARDNVSALFWYIVLPAPYLL